jgi:hypothetical protein
LLSPHAGKSFRALQVYLPEEKWNMQPGAKHIRRVSPKPRHNQQEYFLWCDESDRIGKFYSNFYGGVLVSSKHLKEVHHKLLLACNSLNFKDEIKWHKVSDHYLEKYKAVMDVFFNLLKEGKLKLRIMFTQNRFVPVNLSAQQKFELFYLLYYQFIKHAFGFQYRENDQDAFLRIYFDQLPLKLSRRQEFKTYIRNLQADSAFQAADVKIRKRDITEVDSKRHLLLQLLDVVLGSMCFRLNEKHKEITAGKRRSKRTIAKEKLFRHIRENIKLIIPAFNTSNSTALEKPEDQWLQEYRHWNYKPHAQGISLVL